jgi:hypothetical protein
MGERKFSPDIFTAKLNGQSELDSAVVGDDARVEDLTVVEVVGLFRRFKKTNCWSTF